MIQVLGGTEHEEQVPHTAQNDAHFKVCIISGIVHLVFLDFS